jgi:hypothetical protein
MRLFQTRRTPLKLAAFLFVLLVLFPTSIRTQDVARSDGQFLYNEALGASLDVMNRAWGKLNLTDRGNRAPTDFQNMVVRKDAGITDKLNSEFGDYHVTYLDNASLIGRWKRLRKEFAILVIQPVDRPEGRLKIVVHFSWVNYRRGQLQFEIDSWADVYFRYDTAKRKYVVENVELGGL